MNNFKTIREQAGMTIAEIGRYFNIPYRTVQNWDNGMRKCPDYLLDLMEYKLKNEGILKDNKEN